MFLTGIFTRRVKEVLEPLIGSSPSAQTVSNKEVELIIVEGGSGTGEGVRPGIFIYRDTEVLGSQVKEFSGGVTEEDT